MSFFHAVVIEKGMPSKYQNVVAIRPPFLSEKQDDLIVQLRHCETAEIFVTRVISANVSAKPDRENIAKVDVHTYVYHDYENITRQIALFCTRNLYFLFTYTLHAMI